MSEAPQLEVLLACFKGHKQAVKVHHPLSDQIKADGALTPGRTKRRELVTCEESQHSSPRASQCSRRSRGRGHLLCKQS